jgi:type IV pilus assembly protein PilA
MGIGIRKKTKHGFTLVELMIVVAIIGILAVLAVYGVTKYMTNAKTGEARNSLGQIAKGAVGAYEEERSDQALLDPGASGAKNLHALCDTSNLVPGTLAQVQDKKYQSAASDWNTGTRDKGWPCLKFSLTEPQYFMYGYVADTAKSFVAFAEADLKNAGTATNGLDIQGKLVGGQITVSQQLEESEGAAKQKTAP